MLNMNLFRGVRVKKKKIAYMYLKAHLVFKLYIKKKKNMANNLLEK